MKYKMTIDAADYDIAAIDVQSGVSERRDNLSDNNGFDIALSNIFLEGIHLKWGQYKSEKRKSYSVSPDKETIVAHFCLRGSCISPDKSVLNIQRGECMLFKEEKDDYLFHMDVDHGVGEFFEVSFSPEYYAEHYVDDQFEDAVLGGKEFYSNMAKTPALHSIISDMYTRKDNYNGKLKGLYLESKVSELLLTQLHAIAQEAPEKTKIRLHPADIDAIQHAKDIISQDYEHTTIPALALAVGINQTKLKAGFKALFGQTIFEFLTCIRMEKAQFLLLSSSLPIAEIGSYIGYTYPQHFITAFKRHFGYTPGELRK